MATLRPSYPASYRDYDLRMIGSPNSPNYLTYRVPKAIPPPSNLFKYHSSTLPTRKRRPLSVPSSNSLVTDTWRLRVSPSVSEPSCTTQELTALIKAPSGGIYVLPTDPYNEVYPNIFVGDAATALCTGMLKRLGITHVLNAAQGIERDYGFVNTNEAFYEVAGIKFLGINALDNTRFKLETYFEEAANFIHDAITNRGKVLVHCRQGISRSSTLVLAYLMLKKDMTVQDAIKRVRAHREIIPNRGFLQQLCNLNERLQSLNRRNRGKGL